MWGTAAREPRSPLGLTHERGEHGSHPEADSLDSLGIIFADDRDRCGEIDRADGFAEAVAGFNEVLVAHGHLRLADLRTGRESNFSPHARLDRAVRRRESARRARTE